MKMDKKNKTIIGAEEWCSLGKLGVPAILARIDSGAKTSSIHAFNIHPYKKDKVLWVSFEIHPLQEDRRTVIRCDAEVVDRREIKSSSGVSDKRYVIQTQLTLANQTWDIELTLSNRDSMGYRMLLGREAMKDKMMIDPSESCMLGAISNQDIQEKYVKIQKTPTGLNIGLLASNPSLYSNERLIVAGEERGHNMMFLNVTQCFIKLDAEKL